MKHGAFSVDNIWSDCVLIKFVIYWTRVTWIEFMGVVWYLTVSLTLAPCCSLYMMYVGLLTHTTNLARVWMLTGWCIWLLSNVLSVLDEFAICFSDVVGLSRRHDGSLDHRWIRWWEISPILDAQTRLQMSQVKPRSGDSWRPVLRWTGFSWSDCIRRGSKTDTCSLNRVRQDDLSDVMCSSSLGYMSQTLMFIFSISLYLFSWPPRERVPRSSLE